jgi:hypothetical protein
MGLKRLVEETEYCKTERVVGLVDINHLTQKQKLNPVTKRGYKTNVTESTEESQTETSETIDPDQNYKFKCVSWTVDNSMFEVPSDVTFTDLGAQIQEAQEQVQEAVESACAQIADPTARAACEASLPN